MKKAIYKCKVEIDDDGKVSVCASSGFNDEYSHGYQDCGMKVIEMIDKILEV